MIRPFFRPRSGSFRTTLNSSKTSSLVSSPFRTNTRRVASCSIPYPGSMPAFPTQGSNIAQSAGGFKSLVQSPKMEWLR